MSVTTDRTSVPTIAPSEPEHQRELREFQEWKRIMSLGAIGKDAANSPQTVDADEREARMSDLHG